ncbi:hypothetical protein D4R47_01490 [archaeon]|nr:MAG: hypothetical protein D4R47_01490 [archaeon]
MLRHQEAQRANRHTYRARIGDIRVIYEIIWDSKKVHVLLIKRRERAYQ